MTYSVLLPDGTRHPAADVATLNVWAAEGRIRRETLLAPEGSNATIAAATVPGLQFPVGTAARSQRQAGMSTELRSAWICAGVALFGSLIPCFGRISGAGAVVGLYLARDARRKREPGATLALIANGVALLVAIVWTIVLLRATG